MPAQDKGEGTSKYAESAAERVPRPLGPLGLHVFSTSGINV